MANTQVVGYDLMNEPEKMPEPEEGLWEEASQAAVDAIRSTGDKTRIIVEGYLKRSGDKTKGGIFKFTTYHPDPWITDPLGRMFYSTHGYWTVSPRWTYDETNAYWTEEGY